MKPLPIFCEKTPYIGALSGCCHGAFPLCKEAPEQHDLANADEKQQDGFTNRPECHTLKEMLGFDAVVCLPQSVASLRLRHHVQDLMNRDAGGLQLE